MGTTTTTDDTWREHLAAIRARYTQAEVAARMDPPRDVRTVGNWERGTTVPRPRDQRRLRRLARRMPS